jgi:hypothetical protein
VISAELINITEGCINELVTATNDAVRKLAENEKEELAKRELEEELEKEMHSQSSSAEHNG